MPKLSRKAHSTSQRTGPPARLPKVSRKSHSTTRSTGPLARFIPRTAWRRDNALQCLLSTKGAWKEFVEGYAEQTAAESFAVYVNKVKPKRDECGSHIFGSACDATWSKETQSAAKSTPTKTENFFWPHTIGTAENTMLQISSRLDALVDRGNKLEEITRATKSQLDSMQWMKSVNSVLVDLQEVAEVACLSQAEPEGKTDWLKDVYPPYIEGAITKFNRQVSAKGALP